MTPDAIASVIVVVVTLATFGFVAYLEASQ